MSRNIDRILKETGTLREGHFLLTSGLHSSRYLEKFNILQYPKYASYLCQEIARDFKDKGIELVAGPALGGVIIAYEVAAYLKVKCIFAEREDGKRTFRRGFKLEPATNVLIVDDIVTTGGSLNDMITLVNRYKGNIVGIGVFFDRRSDTGSEEQGIPFYCCKKVPLPSYKPENCPLCTAGMPLVKPGSGL